MKNHSFALAIAIAALLGSTEAAAQSDPCFSTTKTWATSVTNLDVWINSTTAGTTSYGIEELAGPMTTDNFKEATKKAIAIWNEDGGTRIKLVLRGVTIAKIVTGAIVIRSEEDDPTTAGQSFLAQAISQGPTSTTTLTQGEVWFFERTDTVTTTWDWDEESPQGAVIDWVMTLIHELGHAVHTLRHPGTGTCPATNNSVMAQNYPFGYYRNLHLWDRVKAQLKHKRRHNTGRLYMRAWNGSSWNSTIDRGVQRILYRPMSSTNGWGAAGALGFADIETGVLKTRFLRLNAGTITTSTALLEGSYNPVAVAANGSGGLLLLALDNENYSDVDTRICYRLSADSGATWGEKVCPFEPLGGPQYFTTVRHGASVAYDPRSQTYVIAANAAGGALKFQTVPDVGSATPGARTPPITEASTEAPAIACKNAAFGCRVLYSNIADANRKWLTLQVNLSTGLVEVGSVYTQGAYLYNSPQITYSSLDDRFWMTFQQGNRYTGVYHMSATSSTWTSVAAPHYLTASYIIGPTLSVDSSNLRFWVVRYD